MLDTIKISEAQSVGFVPEARGFGVGGMGMESNVPLQLIFVAGGFLAVSGVPGLFLNWRSSSGELVSTLLAVLGAALGLVGSGLVLAVGPGKGVILGWPMPGSEMRLNVDALSAFFLVPVFLMAGLGSIYGMGCWKQSRHPRNAQKLRFFYGLLPASMTLTLAAQNSIHFLIGWEVMALSAFFLIVTEDEDLTVRQAGLLYLMATRMGTLCLFAMFALLRKATGSFALRSLAENEIGLGLMTAIFFLAIVGFGLKAGIMPLHVWLPGAHGSAPSHVSAFLSGVLIKIGIYGLVRICTFLPQPPMGWGGLLLVLGVVSSVFGVVFALGQHNIKRLLAYHSIENIGIIVMGLGLAMMGRSLGRMDWIVLGLGGCLLHVWNHCLFKSLLFFSAGSVIHSVHTGEIDRMGGLAKSMPRTAMLFLIGSMAICGLPPLNGFFSELLVYLGLFHTIGMGDGPAWPVATLAAPFLTMTGALAVACFVKVYGAVFLGAARNLRATRAHEAPASMIAPMIVLATFCAVIGLAPVLSIPVLDRAIMVWSPGSIEASDGFASMVPLSWISFMGMALVVVSAISYKLLETRIRCRVLAGTWDCGYAAPTSRMQYTGSSIAQMLVAFFRWVLRPRTHRPDIHEMFPRTGRFESHLEDTTLECVVVPVLKVGERGLSWFRVIQHGRVQQYVLYILLATVVLLLWMVPPQGLIEKFFYR